MMQEPTNPYFLLAFVVAPLVAIGFGWVLVLVHERSLDKNRRAPGE
ncbi:MAG: hypothetical protein H0T75_03780 [Rhizobiales bacterium]|nr:hypothetical protein [Hyphomicrobiales bacterium]